MQLAIKLFATTHFLFPKIEQIFQLDNLGTLYTL